MFMEISLREVCIVFTVISLVSFCSVGCGQSETAPVTTLVRDGKALVSIVIGKSPTKSAQLAAAELQYHVEKITGTKLPIVSDEAPVNGNVILVGESKATEALGLRSEDFKPQEYTIQCKDGLIVLMGRDKDDRGKLDYANADTFPYVFDEQGTCYAVYDFLERLCDVRWYLPTDLGLVYPKTRTLQVKAFNIRRSPYIKYRRMYYGSYPYPSDLCGDTVDSSNPPPALARRESELFLHRHRQGGQLYGATHSFEGYYDRFLSTHPDWFAQGYEGRPPQLCYTNPELIKQVVQDARDHFDGKPAPGTVGVGDFFALVPMDGSGRWCKCPNCQALMNRSAKRVTKEFTNDSASEYIFFFVNAVAKEIKKSHPYKYISTLAYSDYAFPPSTLKLESNVTIQLCLHARNIHDLKVQETDARVLAAWATESKARPKYLWLYYCFPSMAAVWPDISHDQQQWRCFPGFFAHWIPKQMKAYEQAGVRGIYYEPSYLANSQQSPLMDQLEFYVTWKLADDPSLDGKKLMNEFFTRYYGAAAKPMQAMYELMEKIYAQPKRGHQNEEYAWTKLGSQTNMARLGELMDEAKKAAQTDIEKQRVALFDKGIWQFMLSGRKAYLDRQ